MKETTKIVLRFPNGPISGTDVKLPTTVIREGDGHFFSVTFKTKKQARNFLKKIV